jgi:tetratricopeptide (TPR) repeat protein
MKKPIRKSGKKSKRILFSGIFYFYTYICLTLLFNINRVSANSDAYAMELNAKGRRALDNNPSEAIKLFEQALEIRKKIGENHFHTAAIYNNFGYAYAQLGDFENALPLLEKALAISEKIKNYQVMGSACNNIGLTFSYMGDNQKSLQYYIKALDIRKKYFKEKDDLTLACYLENLGNKWCDLGDPLKGITMLKEGNEIRKNVEDSPESNYTTTGSYAISLCKLADAYTDIGNYAQAIQLCENGLNLYKSIYGPHHVYTTNAYNSLYRIYIKKGDYENALRYSLLTLSIINSEYGKKNSYFMSSNLDVAELYYILGNSSLGLNYFTQFNDSAKSLLQSALRFDEKSRLAWQSKYITYWPASFLSAPAIADFVFCFKGVVLDSIAEDRATSLEVGSTERGSIAIKKLKSLQKAFSKIVLEKGDENDAFKIQEQIGLLERELASNFLSREHQRTNASITPADIMPALAGGGVVVDFIQFKDPKLKGEEAICLGAIITAEDNSPVFVRIDGGKSINRSIENLRSAINQGNAAEVEAQTKFLSEKLWQPVAAKIPERAKRLFICPDANLNFLSFAALLESDGRFVAEKYPIS